MNCPFATFKKSIGKGFVFLAPCAGSVPRSGGPTRRRAQVLMAGTWAIQEDVVRWRTANKNGMAQRLSAPVTIFAHLRLSR